MRLYGYHIVDPILLEKSLEVKNVATMTTGTRTYRVQHVGTKENLKNFGPLPPAQEKLPGPDMVPINEKKTVQVTRT